MNNHQTKNHMKNYYRFIPITGFAAAIALGGPLNAAGTSYESTNKKDKDRQIERSSRSYDKSDHANSRPMNASAILGMDINTADDETIGEIDEIFIDSNTGEVLAVVVSTGGFLGMGQEHTLIALEDLRFNADRTLMQTDISEDQLRSAPRYKAGETANFDRVHPLGKARSNWDTREERADKRPDANLKKNVSDRPETAEMRKEMHKEMRNERTNRLDGVQQNARGLALSDLVGMTVENRQGEAVGQVDEVFIDLEKREVVGVVVSTGGFLGMGDRKNLFGIKEMVIDSTNENIVLDYSRDQIREFPEYKQDEQSVFADLGDRMDRLAPRGNRHSSRTPADMQRSEARNEGYTSDKTVFNQGNSSDEIAMTAAIRTAILEDSALSSRADNVTIITEKGKVVLRGKVNSESEKKSIESIAHEKAGRQNVTSELVVASR